jgi:cytoskeletal protein CcmA (bactofilin family)
MASPVTVIGKSTRVRGRVQGPGDVEVQGFVDGEIAVTGDVTVAQHGMVGAGIKGRRLVVRGAVKGDLVGDEAVLLEDGARVVGDVHAPRVAIAVGALVRGFVETGEGASAPRAARATTAARPVERPAAAPARAPERAHTPERAPAPAHAPAPARAHAPAPAHASAPAKAAPPAARPDAAGSNNSASNNSGPRRPPPPVVPVLKGAKGQIAKKKER